MVVKRLIQALTVALLCAGCITTPEVAKPPQKVAKAAKGYLRMASGCAPRVAFCIVVEDDPPIYYETEKICQENLDEMTGLVKFQLLRNMVPGPYMIDKICGDKTDLANYNIYINLLADQMRLQLEGRKKGEGV